MTTYTIIPAATTLPTDTSFQAHREALLALWKQNLKFCFDGRFEWLYQKGRENITVATWLAMDEGRKKIVGCASILKRNFIYQGQVIKAGIAVDFAVNKEHRVFGPALSLTREVANGGKTQGIDFIFAYPNNKGGLLFKRAGYKEIGSSRLWVLVLRSEGKLRKYIKNSFLRMVAAKLINTSLGAFGYLFAFHHNNRSVCREQKHADRSFDILWNAEKNRNVIMSEKNADSLNWRYAENASKEYRFFCRYNKSGDKLLGFIVFGIEDKVCVVYDFFSKSDRREHGILLDSFVHHIRKTNAESIVLNYLGDPLFEGALRRRLFFESRDERMCLLLPCRLLSVISSDALIKSSTWNLFDGDLDL